ncbi:MAG: hypothetical protein JO170_05550 [Verrucomicrobia bacterium]|nr:hypothetical protein [Verrucomicrobiota bacterium]
MENTKLIELRRAYDTEFSSGRYSSAEQVCWRALEICGYRGTHRKFSYWLTCARLQEDAVSLWQWSCLLADIYYELGKYTEAEPVYAKLALVWMSLPSDWKERAAGTRTLLSDLLRKLAGAEAFIGKGRRAGKHWTLAKVLSGKRISPQTVDGTAIALGPRATSRANVRSMLPTRGNSGSCLRRRASFTRRSRFRRN